METTTRFLLSIAFLTIPAALFAQPDGQAVQKSFDAYKNAILKDKGEEASKYVDSKTIKYYSAMLDHIRNSDSVTVDKLSLLDKIVILRIRQELTKEDVASMDGKGLFVYAIQKGLVGKNSVKQNEIGKIIFDGDRAKAQLVAAGKASNIYFDFNKEDGQWKIDLTSIFPIAEQAFRQMVKEADAPDNEYLFFLLEAATGVAPTDKIWLPLK